jgi:hypothetical protein
MKPYDTLTVHRDVDTATIFVARSAVKAFLTKAGRSMKIMEKQLEAAHVRMDRNAFKVLGEGTEYRVGQQRCWKIDATKLGGLATPQMPPAAAAQGASNVVPITGGKAA